MQLMQVYLRDFTTGMVKHEDEGCECETAPQVE